MTSRLPGFHKLSLEGRIARLKQLGLIDDEQAKALLNPVPLDLLGDLSENVVGRFELPVGLATNFVVDGRELLVPMATEEASVVAAASNAAKWARPHGGFRATGGEPEMIAQVHIVDCDAYQGQAQVLAARREVLAALREGDPMAARGGGVRDLEAYARHLEDGTEFLVVHLVADVRDAMGANYMNGLAERAAPLIADIAGGRPLLRILSNLATKRVVRVEATFDARELGGGQVARDVVLANEIAKVDQHRATTHNKGVLNGIAAVALATGNDVRAVEAGCHSYAVRTGAYRALTHYAVTPQGHLRGVLDVPLALGIVGGVTRVHPQARANLSVLGVKSARELAHVAAAVGLAQNAAALRALVAEGIQRGHMALHATTLARQAGVPDELLHAVVHAMIERGEVSESAARRIARERGARTP